MLNFNYSRDEAQALVGKRFETLVEWDQVTRGMRGRVVWASGCTVWASRGSYENYEVVIAWDLPNGGMGTREQPAQDWFSKFQMQAYMREVKS